MSTNQQSYKGTCFCAEVEVQAQGEPVGMGFCHCADCRSWSGSPVNAFTLWKASAVKITHGQEHVAEFGKTERSHRKWCKKCGGHLMTIHPQWDLIDIFAAILPELPFTPGVHVNYEHRVLPMHDGLPKLKDFPAELGGTGQQLEE